MWWGNAMKTDAMNWTRLPQRITLTAALIWGIAISGIGPLAIHATAQQPQSQSQSAEAQENPLVIDNDSQLPDAFPRRSYMVHLTAHGGTAPLRWRIKKGTLPPGFKLDFGGMIHGEAERGGEFQFTVSVTDSGSPQQAVQKQFVIRVRSAFNLNWKSPAKVNGNRIEGSVEVSNITPDDIDLTFVVLAVAQDGRATAIGYQHFSLPAGTAEQDLPFGETLPRGAYVVHVDVVGEVAEKNLIYRERMQTPGPLHITVGP
jgi:hypothetical protein